MDASSPAAAGLPRPMSIGELLNRTLAAYAQKAGPLFAILAAIAIPVAIFEYYTQFSFANFVNVLDRLATLPPDATIARSRALTELSRSIPSGWQQLLVVVDLLVYQLARTAAIAFAAGSLDGRNPTIGSAYRVALQRWVAQISVAIAFFGIVLVGAVAVFIAALIVVAVAVTLAGLAHVPLAAAGIVAGVVTGVAAIALLSFANVAWLGASVSVVTEDPNPVRAVATALRRTIDRALLRRTFGAALMIVAVNWCGAVAAVPLAALAASATHLPVAFAVVAACARALLDGATGVFMVLFTRDTIVRRDPPRVVISPAPVPGDAGEPPDRNDGLEREDRLEIARYLATRATLEPRAAVDVAARIATRVRPKLKASFHYLNDADLLEHLGR